MGGHSGLGGGRQQRISVLEMFDPSIFSSPESAKRRAVRNGDCSEQCGIIRRDCTWVSVCGMASSKCGHRIHCTSRSRLDSPFVLVIVVCCLVLFGYLGFIIGLNGQERREGRCFSFRYNASLCSMDAECEWEEEGGGGGGGGGNSDCRVSASVWLRGVIIILLGASVVVCVSLALFWYGLMFVATKSRTRTSTSASLSLSTFSSLSSSTSSSSSSLLIPTTNSRDG